MRECRPGGAAEGHSEASPVSGASWRVHFERERNSVSCAGPPHVLSVDVSLYCRPGPLGA